MVTKSFSISTQSEKTSYIREVFQTIVERDIIQRYKLSDAFLLNKIAEYLMGNVSNTTSARSVTGVLQTEQMNTNHVTVRNYMDYLCRTFLFYQVKRLFLNWQIKGTMAAQTPTSWMESPEQMVR